MSKRPELLSYESQKAIMEKLNLKTRNKVACQCPSLRNVDTLLPIQIQKLRLEERSFTLDNVTYKIGIIKKYIDERTPDCVESINRNGGVPYDVDRYGLKLEGRIEPEDDNVREAQLERQLERIRERRNRLRDVSWTEQPRWNREIRKIQEELRILQYKRQGIAPPFNLYIQVMTTPVNGTPTFEYLNYDRPIEEARDYLIRKVFGVGRLVKIENLELGKETANRCEIEFIVQIRSPPRLPVPYFPFEASSNIDPRRFQVKNLVINSNVMDALNIILVVVNTLDFIKVPYGQLPFLEEPTFQAARFLSIMGVVPLTVLNKVTNQRVHLERCRYTERQFLELATNWKKSQNKIGTFYSIGFRDGGEAEKFVELFKALDNAVVGEIDETRWTNFPHCAVLALSDTSELNVWCEETSEADLEYCNLIFIVKMKVQPNGHATVIE